MIRSGITSLLLLFSLLSFAQEHILELDINIANKNEFLHERSFIDPVLNGQQFFLSLPCKNKLGLYLLDNNGKIISSFNKNRESTADSSGSATDEDSSPIQKDIFFRKNFSPAGSISTGTNKILCAFTESDHAIYFNDIDFNARQLSAREEWDASKKERLLFCFSYANRFFWITVNKKSLTTLKLYRYDAYGKTDTMSVLLDTFFPTEMTPGTHYWSNETSLVHPERITTLLQSSLRGKFILQGNKLYIVSDENTAFTDISIVDLDTLSFQQFDVDYPLPPGTITATGLINHNSFIAGDLLLQSNIQNNIFSFSIGSLQDRAQKKMYHFSKSDEINLNNGPVMQYGTAMDPKEEKELTKTRQFIRKVNGKGLAILAGFHENKLQAQIGSSELVSGGGGGGMIYMGGSSFSTPGGMVSMPGHWTSFGGGGYRSTRTVFFFSVFDKTNFEHLTNSEPAADKIKKLDDLLDKNSRHLNDPVQAGNRIISGYLNTDSKKFILFHI